jgi:TolA-binding protein
MSAFSRSILACGIFLVLSTSAFAQSAAAPVAPPDWPVTTAPVRYMVQKGDPSMSGRISYVNIFPADPKWVTMPMRVFNDKGVAVGSDVLWYGPGEPATVLFDSSSDANQYKIYLGSNWPVMHLPDEKAGIWLETRAGNGKMINNLPDMLQAWNQSTTVLGRTLVYSIFEGGNRFGPQGNQFLHFKGWFELPAPTQLHLAVVSVDSSFVLVDGKEVAEWPGAHDWNGGMQGQHQGEIDVPAGLHFLDYYNDYVPSEGGRPPILACLAVKGGPLANWTMPTPPGKFFRLTPEFSLSACNVQPGSQTSGNVSPLVFAWWNKEQSVMNTDAPDVGFIAMNLIDDSNIPGTETWTFDDGTTQQGQNIIHLFPRPGMRKVTLTLKSGDKEVGTLTQTISVHPDWKNSDKDTDLHPEHAADIMSRDPAAMSVPDLASCFAVFGAFQEGDGLLKFLPTVCAKMKDISDTDLPYISVGALYLVRDDWTHVAEETQLLQAIIDRTSVANPSPQLVTIGSQCRLRLAQLTLKTSDKTDEVSSLIAAINVSLLKNEEPRMLQLLQADLALAKGDIVGAKKQYQDLTGQPSGPDARSSIRRTARIGQARAFMDRKDYQAADDALREVAWQAPIEKLSPDWALTRMRLYQEQDLPDAAYVWGKRLLPVITGGGRSELLFRLTDLAFARKDDDLAHKTLDELMKKHPYSEEAAQAKEKWPVTE